MMVSVEVYKKQGAVGEKSSDLCKYSNSPPESCSRPQTILREGYRDWAGIDAFRYVRIDQWQIARSTRPLDTLLGNTAL